MNLSRDWGFNINLPATIIGTIVSKAHNALRRSKVRSTLSRLRNLLDYAYSAL